MKKQGFQTLILIVIFSFMGIIAGKDFLKTRDLPSIFPGQGVTGIKKLSEYLPNLEGTAGDSDVYILDSGEKGGTLVLLGGTHPDEPAANLAAVLVIENVTVQKGRIIVIPEANRSAMTHSQPLEAYPTRYHIVNSNGVERTFAFGSRLTNQVDQLPDPDIYIHYPSGQKLSGEESRNLNRSYPGRPDGRFIERVSYGITNLVKAEEADLEIDLHEAPLEYFFINSMLANNRGQDVATMAVFNLISQGITMGLESAPRNLEGFSYGGIGARTRAKTFLMEAANPIQGRFRGSTTENLILEGKDSCYLKASKLKRLFVPYDEKGLPLSLRTARHVTAVKAIIDSANDFDPDKEIKVANWPEYNKILENVGQYLNGPETAATQR